MTENNDARVRELVSELVDASPTAPAFLELTARHTKTRRPRRVVGLVVLVVVLGGAFGGIAILRRDDSAEGPTSQVRVDVPRPDAAPRYLDPSKPPPLRITAAGHSVDVSTMLGCWFHVPGDAAGHGGGLCADGAVDPSRFRLNVAPRQRVVLRLPIEASVTAFLGDAPPPPPPHALATPVTNKHTLRLRRDGAAVWSFAFAGADHDLALLIDIRANTSINGVRVSGDAYYGMTLVTHR